MPMYAIYTKTYDAFPPLVERAGHGNYETFESLPDAVAAVVSGRCDSLLVQRLELDAEGDERKAALIAYVRAYGGRVVEG